MAKNKKRRAEQDPYPFAPMCGSITGIYLYLMIFAFPLLMNETKYGAITAFKGRLFYILFIITAVLLCLAGILSVSTKTSASLTDSDAARKKLLRAPFLADFALLAYWLAALISTLAAQDVSTAFWGLVPRNNGFLIQTFYIATYFILSYGLLPKISHALAFAWGGAALSIACMLHFFGVDLYNVASVNGAEYAGPFFNVGSYKFMGPVGNVNLGSYILTVCCVIAAGLFVAGVKLEFDKKNLITLGCFAMTLWAELNINTDAGLVALLAALLVLPAALCISFERLVRMTGLFAVSCGVILFDRLLVDIALRGKSFGKTELLLCALTVLLGGAWALLSLFGVKNGFSEKRIFSQKCLRNACLAAMAFLMVCGVAASLLLSERDGLAAGPVTGAYYKLEEHDYNDHTNSFLEEFGNMLRGNFDDSFGHNRLFTWKRTLKLAALRPVFGLGLDNFKANFARYFGDEAAIMFPSSGGGVDKAHNEYLDVLVDNGAVGLIFYLAFFAALLCYALRRRKNGGLAPVFAVAVCAYMAHAFFGYQLPLQSPLMWVLIGVCAAFVRSEEPPEAPCLTEEPLLLKCFGGGKTSS